MSRPASPPRWALALFAATAPPSDRDAMLGDLAEEFALRSASGVARARVWYWRQVLASLPTNVLRSLRAERPRRKRGDGLLRTTAQELHFAARTLVRRRGFSSLLILTLGLGIAANTVVFGLVRSLLLRPLPYREPERLALVWGTNLRAGQPRDVISGPTFLDLEGRSAAFDGLAAFHFSDLTARTEEGTGVLPALEATTGLFSVLGVTPLLGRGFEKADGLPGAGPVVVLTHGFWQRRFAGDPAAVGRTLASIGQPHVIVGVLPPSYRFFEAHDVVTPLSAAKLEQEPRSYYFYWVLGRLKPGVAARAAKADLDEVLAQQEREHPNLAGWQATVDPLQELLAEPIRPALVFLMVSAGLLLLIGCANAANLLLARLVDRAREIAARAALGATPARLIRGLLAENVLLAGAAGLVGWGVASAALAALARVLSGSVAVAGSAAMVALAPIETDASVLGFAVLVSLACSLLFGLLPSSRAVRLDLARCLAGGRASADPGRTRARDVLLFAQTALATALLVASGLMLRSVVALQETDAGFSVEKVATMYVGRLHDLEATQRVQFYERVLQSARSVPGVAWAGLNDYLPLKSEDDYEGFEIAGRPAKPGSLPREEWRRVGGDYFRALGMRLVRGRSLLPSDDATAPSVALVNEALARKYWPGEDPLGRRIRITYKGYGWSEIVGIVADAREASLDRPAKPMLFVPYQRGPRPHMALFVKTAGDPLAVFPELRRAIAKADPTQPITEEGTLLGLARSSLAVRRLTLQILASLAGIALVLTVAGVFGVLSYLVARRTREIGTRMALGARRADVLRLVVGRSLRVVALGAVAGLAAALGLARLQTSLLYGVAPTDPPTLAAVVLLVLATAAVACLVPARRAAQLDPLEALRHD